MSLQANVDIVHVDATSAIARMQRIGVKLSMTGLQAFMHGTVVPWLQMRAADRFSQEGDDAVGKWSPLKQATMYLRANQGFPPAHPINVRTGQMRNFIVHASGNVTAAPGIASLNWPGPTGRIKSIDEKIRTAQMGKPSPSTVARPVLAVSMKDTIFVMAATTAYLVT